MAFCPNCGVQLTNQDHFCKECGARVIPEADQSTPVSAPYRRISRKNIILLIAAAVLIVVLFGGYKFGAYWMSDERLIGKLEEALQQEDGEALAGLLYSEDEGLIINEQSTRSFLKYIDSNPDVLKAMVNSLKKQSYLLESEETASNEDNQVIQLTRSGKFLFYDKYQLTVAPVFITLATNYKDVALFIDGQEVARSDKPDYQHKFGPFLPGSYELEAKLQTDFVELNNKEDAIIWDGGKHYSASLFLEGEEVFIHTGVEQSGLIGRLFINDKDVGINPFQTNSFGPVTVDGSMKLSIEADYPWGTMRSSDIIIDQTELEISLANSSSFQTALIDTVSEYNKQKIEALTSGDVQKVTSGTKKAKSTIQDRIDNSKQSQLLYSGKYLGGQFDLDSFSLSYEQEQWNASLILIANYEEIQYYAGQSLPELMEEGQGQSVYLSYDAAQKEWLVEEVYTFYDGYDFSENLKEIVEKDPIQYTTIWDSTLSAANLEVNESTMQAFMSDYVSKSVQAINNHDFTLVSSLLDPAGPAYRESEKYIDYLESKGITEEVVSVYLDQLQMIDDNNYEVSTSEAYKISYGDGSVKEKTYKTVYKVVKINGDLQMHQLISTKEQ